LWELDTDKSGGVSFEEFRKGRVFQKLPDEKQQAVFRRLDSDGDGQVTLKDKPERPFMRRHGGGGWHGDDSSASKPGLRQLLRQLDKDGDGAVSFEEFRNGDGHRQLAEDEQEDRFEALDQNRDGKLTETDLPPRRQRGEAPSEPGPPPAKE
jgi:Ca2+-binding EF-hand superfamily protein